MEVEVAGWGGVVCVQGTALPRDNGLCRRGLRRRQLGFMAKAWWWWARPREPGPDHAGPCRSYREFGFYCRCDKKPSQWLLSKEEEDLAIF